MIGSGRRTSIIHCVVYVTMAWNRIRVMVPYVLLKLCLDDAKVGFCSLCRFKCARWLPRRWWTKMCAPRGTQVWTLIILSDMQNENMRRQDRLSMKQWKEKIELLEGWTNVWGQHIVCVCLNVRDILWCLYSSIFARSVAAFLSNAIVRSSCSGCLKSDDWNVVQTATMAVCWPFSNTMIFIHCPHDLT